MSENATAAAPETPAINSAVPEIALQEAPQNSSTAPDKVAAQERKQARNTSHADREARKAELLASLRTSKEAERGKAEDKPEAASDAAKGIDSGEAKASEPKTEAKPEKDRSVATIAKQSQEIRELKAKIAQFDGKAPPNVETKADFIEKAKADLSVLLQELDPDGSFQLLSKLASVVHRELTPEEKLKHEVDEKLASFEKKAADAEQGKKDAETKALDQTLYTGTAQILNHGFKNEDGSITIDNSKWPLCQKVTKASEHDAPRMAMNIVTALTKDLGRAPNHRETATFMEIAFDQLEQTFSKKAEAYRLDPPATKEPTKTNTVDRAKDQPPKTINSRMASGGRLPAITPKPVTRAEREARKTEIMNKYTRQRAQEMRG
jgi:hypothetical protein